jgi:GNAT superfamily N-acetyltransferase
MQPAVLQRLAGAVGRIGVIDATLAAVGVGGGGLPEQSGLDEHPRVQLARALRKDVRVYGDERGLVTLARGLAGRTELSIEVRADQQGHGHGRSLIRDALGLVPAGHLLFAAVSPGNARSLRAFLAVGFRPVGSEVIITDG